MPDIDALLPQLTSSTAGTFLAWILVLFFGPMAILSEKTADRFGLLGVIARWFRDAKKRAIMKDQELSELQVQTLRAEIAEVDQVNKARIERANAEIEKCALEIERLSAVEMEQHDYIVWVTQLARSWEVWAAAQGLELPPPPFVTFKEWLAQNKE